VHDGSIVSPWRARFDNLYYIADDLRTTVDAQSNNRVWTPPPWRGP
jgi:hypothetical protein